MFERKINGKLHNKEKKELLAYFNKATRKNAKEIRPVKIHFGIQDANEAYEHLRDLYNQEVDNQRKDVGKKEKEFYKQNVIETKMKPYKNKETFDIFKDVYERFRNMMGKEVIFQYVVDRRFIRNVEVSIPSDGFPTFWSKFTRDVLMHDSDSTIFQEHEYKGKILIFENKPEIKKTKVKQYFRDGVNHCVFEPIQQWAQKILDDSTNKKTIERYRAIVNHCKKYVEKYNDGVPEEVLPEICNKLQINLEIQLPFMEKSFFKYECNKKALKTFKFLNTRTNHVEVNNIVNTDNFEEVSLKELYEIKDNLDKSGEFYTYKRGRYNIQQISTLYKVYKTNGNYGKIVQEFEKETGLSYCKLDDFKDANVSHFITNGTHYNETVDFVDVKQIEKTEYKYDEEKEKFITTACEYNGQKINHIDMYKAYSQFKKCKWYNGFLGKVTDYRPTDKVMGEGYYYITNLDFDNCPEFEALNCQLQIFRDNNVYTSPELRFLDEIGVRYTITQGCWGIEPFHFEFNEDMMNCRDEDNTPYYSRWTGACDQHHYSQKFYFGIFFIR